LRCIYKTQQAERRVHQLADRFSTVTTNTLGVGVDFVKARERRRVNRRDIKLRHSAPRAASAVRYSSNLRISAASETNGKLSQAQNTANADRTRSVSHLRAWLAKPAPPLQTWPQMQVR